MYVECPEHDNLLLLTGPLVPECPPQLPPAPGTGMSQGLIHHHPQFCTLQALLVALKSALCRTHAIPFAMMRQDLVKDGNGEGTTWEEKKPVNDGIN